MTSVHTKSEPLSGKKLQKLAVTLLDQQCWCWGQDVQHPDGNWLLKVGFERIPPPEKRKGCSSVYQQEIGNGRQIVLRGFGVYFGDEKLGGVLLPRFGFRPQYTSVGTLNCPPWSSEDFPTLRPPTESQRKKCETLTLDLIDWIWHYECEVALRLGLDYRKTAIANWELAKSPPIPAEDFASNWKLLKDRLVAESSTFFG